MNSAADVISNDSHEAREIFTTVWAQLESDPSQSLHFPHELIWLGGAPGAGKGTNTPYLMKIREISAQPLVISDLLVTPEMQAIKNGGNLVKDADVIGLLFRKLTDEIYREGVVIDGFPRTGVQAEVLKLFHDRLNELHDRHQGTPQAPNFPKPQFQIALLYVDEAESVARQIGRGREIIEHNQRVRETGSGTLLEERATDVSETAARKRYRIFRDTTFKALYQLKDFFPFHLIDAKASLAEVQARIENEFAFERAVALEAETYDKIRSVPSAEAIVRHARQELTHRLNGYAAHNADLLERVVRGIREIFLPILEKYAMAGRARISSEDPLFENPLAIQILIDVFAERGYFMTADIQKNQVASHVDLKTGAVKMDRRRVVRFEVHFERPRSRGSERR